MPTIADFTVVQDEPFTLPTETDPPRSQREFRDISFPAVNASSPAVLMFRVTMFGDTSTIQVKLSDDPRFTESVRTALGGMRFRPARRGGKAVRQLVEQRFRFQIARPSLVAEEIS